ncbi:DNA repair protein RAD51 homolog 3 [Fopius arisanus]|uniref:DNA repair protein RAD51 homolog 3 n=1 Tax=Fopius arisanus TaxID=64838 RepID=A0A0C9PX14_9HYME|nr:PREDICTED: DNA repair protein RAD51 homolog 3-like [Fopius arisanus]
MLRPLGTFSLSQYTLELLAKNGFNYLEDVLKAPEAARRFVDVDELIKASTPIHAVSALDQWQAELLCHRVTTFSKALDSLLEGGVPCGSITELCGAPGSGKTQICFQLCLTTQLPQMEGGLDGPVLFIDSRRGFSPRRLQELIVGYHKDFPDAGTRNFLRGVTVVTIRTAQDLFSIIEGIREYLKSDNLLRVVIIDSLSLPVLCSIENSFVRYKFYCKVFEELQKLASEYNIAIVIVNELVTQVDAKKNIGFVSGGGQTVANRCQRRLLLARLNDIVFAAKILKSPVFPQRARTFRVTADGIRK